VEWNENGTNNNNNNNGDDDGEDNEEVGIIIIIIITTRKLYCARNEGRVQINCRLVMVSASSGKKLGAAVAAQQQQPPRRWRKDITGGLTGWCKNSPLDCRHGARPFVVKF
jgi:hypothetical protein